MPEQRKIVSVADLIQNMEKIRDRKPKKGSVYVEDLGGNVIIIEMRVAVLDEAREMGQEGGKDSGDCHIIAESVVEPDFHNADLLKKYSVPGSVDLVRKLLKPATIRSLSLEIVKFSGFTGSTVGIVEELKN
jgi:hypothetical protein